MARAWWLTLCPHHCVLNEMFVVEVFGGQTRWLTSLIEHLPASGWLSFYCPCDRIALGHPDESWETLGNKAQQTWSTYCG